MKKQLRQVGVTGMIVASLAASSGTLAASSSPARVSRPQAQSSTTRRQTEAVYQRRLSFLAKVLETDSRELELSLTRLANQQPATGTGQDA